MYNKNLLTPFHLPNLNCAEFTSLRDRISFDTVKHYTKDDFIENFSTLIEVLDYPIVGPGALPQFMVDKEASKHGKVILTGQGGDQRFAGDARYLLNYLEQTIKGRHNQRDGASLI